MRGLSLGVGLALAGCLAMPASAATTGVDVANFSFTPATVHVAPGDTVTWTFRGPDLNHSVTADDGSFDSDAGNNSPLHVPGDTFSQTFNSDGTFTYHCKIHSFMHGTVVVGTAPPPDTQAPAITNLRVKKRRARFTLSEDASVGLALKRSGGGKKSLTRSATKGANSIALPRLRSGRWSLKLVATDAAGNRSPAAKTHFKVS